MERMTCAESISRLNFYLVKIVIITDNNDKQT